MDLCKDVCAVAKAFYRLPHRHVLQWVEVTCVCVLCLTIQYCTAVTVTLGDDLSSGRFNGQASSSSTTCSLERSCELIINVYEPMLLTSLNALFIKLLTVSMVIGGKAVQRSLASSSIKSGVSHRRESDDYMM